MDNVARKTNIDSMAVVTDITTVTIFNGILLYVYVL